MDIFRGKRDNFVKEQMSIHVISFSKLSGVELYELLVSHVQVSLNQAQNTFTSFTAYKTVPAAG